MNFWVKVFTVFFLTQLTVLIVTFLANDQNGWTNFVDHNFYIGLFLLMIGLLIMITKKGFFNVVTEGIRKVFFKNQIEQDPDEYRPLSTLMNISYGWMIGSGMLLIAISLFSYFFTFSY
ncbi:hypothetical protein GCM10008967_14760 [Bacillus carboniphilus]|uniref:DUF3899 domain-containing protein n=1 Tax=Bacillus carboniphilus TaxID=86663 RepID=A0ABP3FV65_9BACI